MALTLDEAKKMQLIDKSNLDEELTHNTYNYSTIGELAAEAVSRRDFLKDEVEAVSAKLGKDYRESMDKVTEGKVAEYVQLHPDYQEVRSEYLKAKLDADKWIAQRESFGQRAMMLRDLCNLYNSEYFARESVKSKAEREVEYKGLRKTVAAARTGE